jgi:hypothetical protein
MHHAPNDQSHPNRRSTSASGAPHSTTSVRSDGDQHEMGMVVEPRDELVGLRRWRDEGLVERVLADLRHEVRAGEPSRRVGGELRRAREQVGDHGDRGREAKGPAEAPVDLRERVTAQPAQASGPASRNRRIDRPCRRRRTKRQTEHLENEQVVGVVGAAPRRPVRIEADAGHGAERRQQAPPEADEEAEREHPVHGLPHVERGRVERRGEDAQRAHRPPLLGA